MSQQAAVQSGTTTPNAALVGGVVISIREFLAFKLGDEEYGMDILRGVIVPIIDMRIKFNLERVNYDTFTVVIVLNIGKQVVGVVVDGVSDVITLTPEQLRPVPEFSSAIGSDHLLAIGSVQDRMLILLDIEKLMISAEMGLIAETVR